MAATLQETGYEVTRSGAAAGAGASPARALLLTALAWAAVVTASWLAWWQMGPAGREALAATVGLPVREFTFYVMAALVAEKVLVKGLFFAALYHALRGRAAPAPGAGG